MIFLKHKPHDDFSVYKPSGVSIILRMKSKICILASNAFCDLAYLYTFTLIATSHSPPQLYSANFSFPKAPSSLPNLQAIVYAIPSAWNIFTLLSFAWLT